MSEHPAPRCPECCEHGIPLKWACWWCEGDLADYLGPAEDEPQWLCPHGIGEAPMSTRTVFSRVLHAVAYAPPCGLPVRCWRLIWLIIPVRLLIALPVSCIIWAPYLLAKAVVWAGDEIGGWFGDLYFRMYNADLRRSGWARAAARAPAPQLSDGWQARTGEGSPS